MLLKNYLNKLFSLSYYQLLLKRHKSLFIVPLVLFICVLFLFLLLGADVESVFLYIVPCALVLVPTSALILFKTYTKKGDVAYLASIPLTRTQLFMTTYLVGITFIELLLLIMVFIGCMNTPYDLFESLVVFLSLGVIYFTFASLGCMLSGQLFKQIINMGVICFAPIGLYLLSKWGIGEITFGGYVTPVDNSLVMLICPLISAANFLDDLVWPYFLVHLGLVIGCLGLCIYLMKHRPLEKTEQNTLFKTVQQWLVLPVVCLNIVYFLFNILAETILTQQHYFDKSYYVSVILLLVGVSLLVGILMSIWKSKTIKDIFNLKELGYQVVLVLVSITLFMVPLWQTENARTKDLDDYVEVNIGLPLSVRHEWNTVDKNSIVDFLDHASKNRHLFLNQYGDACIFIDYNQRYYFNFDEMDSNTKSFIEKVYMQQRAKDDYWAYVDDQLIDGEVIDVNSMKAAIMDTYESSMSDTFIQNLNMEIDHLYETQWGSKIGAYYIYTFSSLNYDDWLEKVESNSKVLVSKDEWKEIEKVVKDACSHPLNYTVTSKYLGKIAKNINVLDMDYPENWIIESVSEKQVKMKVAVDAYILDDCSFDGFDLFKDTDTWLTFEVEVNVMNGYWIPTLTGVYY